MAAAYWWWPLLQLLLQLLLLVLVGALFAATRPSRTMTTTIVEALRSFLYAVALPSLVLRGLATQVNFAQVETWRFVAARRLGGLCNFITDSLNFILLLRRVSSMAARLL